LVKYDDEVLAAAETLRPFGDSRVNELAEAYFALNEDKRYLPNIVSRITEEAKQDEARQWANRFRYAVDGEPCTQESLNMSSSSGITGVYAECWKQQNYRCDQEHFKTVPSIK
jgi:hypothetical protein